MRKRIITPVPQGAPATEGDWLDVGGAAAVEVTSEDKAHPIEGALLPGEKRGWRAAGSGTQTIRILFDKPQAATLAHRWRVCVWPDKPSLAVAEPKRRKKDTKNG